jgi:hypothetical protein
VWHVQCLCADPAPSLCLCLGVQSERNLAAHKFAEPQVFSELVQAVRRDEQLRARLQVVGDGVKAALDAVKVRVLPSPPFVLFVVCLEARGGAVQCGCALCVSAALSHPVWSGCCVSVRVHSIWAMQGSKTLVFVMMRGVGVGDEGARVIADALKVRVPVCCCWLWGEELCLLFLCVSPHSSC